MSYLLWKLWLCCCFTVTVVHCEQRCCNGTVYGKTSGFRCCGNTTYNSNSTSNIICCNGVLITISNASNAVGCCGLNGTYKYRTERCCSGLKLEKPLTETSIEYQCCGQKLYNPLQFTCCGESQLNLVNITGDMACCGQSMYNATVHKCCESRQVRSGGHSAEVIDHALYLRNQTSPGFECCGSKLIDYTKYKCCGNEIVNISGSGHGNFQCCYGPLKNNPEVDQVCEGQHLYDNENTFDCCDHSHPGTVKFDSESQECCGDVLLPKSVAKGKVCCPVVDCYKI